LSSSSFSGHCCSKVPQEQHLSLLLLHLNLLQHRTAAAARPVQWCLKLHQQVLLQAAAAAAAGGRAAAMQAEGQVTAAGGAAEGTVLVLLL
jgi:hypothetical protein